MTYAILHTRAHGSATLAGPELHRAHGLIGDLGTAMLRPALIVDRLRSLLPARHHLHQLSGFDFQDAYRKEFARAQEDLFVHQGKTLSVVDFQLNTTMSLASDPLRLLVRIAYTGERHCWIAGPDRARIADIIEHGVLYSRVLRTGMGWEAPIEGEHSLISLLRADATEPAVFSHSFGSDFPNCDIGSWTPPLPSGVHALEELDEQQQEESYEAWYTLDTDTRWAHSTAGLVDFRRLDPADLHMAFGHGLTVMDLHSESWETYLDIGANR